MPAGTARQAIGQQTDEAGEALWQEAAHKGKGLQVPRRSSTSCSAYNS